MWCVAYTLSFVGWYVLVVVNCLMWGVRSLLALSVPSLSNGVRCLLRVVSWLLCIVCCVLYDVLVAVLFVVCCFNCGCWVFVVACCPLCVADCALFGVRCSLFVAVRCCLLLFFVVC